MRYERYHIPIETVPSTAPPVPKFVITRSPNCVNCGKCEKACIFGVHKRREDDPREMADPVSHLCKNCFRCISDCPQRALTMSLGQDYRALGRGIWTPLRVSTIWGEAETGKIPVLGAGYRGMFAGPDYDGVWTDMSEIVRPTRDGIHGRETISTSVDIGRMPLSLEFDASGKLATELSPVVELSIPMIFDVTRLEAAGPNALMGFALAAKALDTFLLIPQERITKELMEVAPAQIVPVHSEGTDVKSLEVDPRTRMVELRVGTSWKNWAKAFAKRFPDKILSLRIQASKGVENTVLEMLDAEVPVAHLEYDEDGREHGRGETRHAKDSLRAVHTTMTAEGVRDEITVIAAGGLAAAEHVPKTIVCGADAVSLETALMVALSCRLCSTCKPSSCPASIGEADPEWVQGRVTNLVGAWRDQMLEMLGAMGIREVRRLRGEVGRAIFYDDIQKEFLSTLSGGGEHG
ncbi:MAG: glutamate synthase-related protein [Thermoplasmata archaeon]